MLLSICNVETIQNILHVISLWWLCITFVWPRGSKKLPTTAPSIDWNAIWGYFTLLRLCLDLLFFISIDLNLVLSTIELQVQVNICQKLFFLENMLCTKIALNVRNNFCTQHVLLRFELWIFIYWTCKSMNNLSSYCGLVDAKIRASDKDLPVLKIACNLEFIFFPKLHSKSTSKFPFIDNLKKPSWDGQVITTLRYVKLLISVYNTKKEKMFVG